MYWPEQWTVTEKIKQAHKNGSKALLHYHRPFAVTAGVNTRVELLVPDMWISAPPSFICLHRVSLDSLCELLAWPCLCYLSPICLLSTCVLSGQCFVILDLDVNCLEWAHFLTFQVRAQSLHKRPLDDDHVPVSLSAASLPLSDVTLLERSIPPLLSFKPLGLNKNFYIPPSPPTHTHTTLLLNFHPSRVRDRLGNGTVVSVK